MGLPRGLANFDLYLIQASAAHSWEALGNILSFTGQNELTTLLAAGLIARTLLELKPFPKLLSPLLLLIFGFWVHFSQAASPDLLLLAFTFTLLKAQERSKLLLILLLPLLKLQGALIALFLVISFWKSAYFKKSLVILAISAILAAAKLIWLAGWLPVVGSLHLPWSITEAGATFISRSVTGHQGLNSGVYLSAFLRLRWLDSLVMLAHLSSLLLLFFGIRQHSPAGAKSFALRHLFLFGIWLLLFPQGRYLLGMWTLLFVDSATLLKTSWTGFHNKPKLALTLGTGLLAALVPLQHLLPGNSRWQHFFDYSGFANIAWVKPHPLWQLPTRLHTLPGNFHFHVPKGPQYCFDSAFPCREWPGAAYGTDSTALSPCYWVDNSYFSSQKNPDKNTRGHSAK